MEMKASSSRKFKGDAAHCLPNIWDRFGNFALKLFIEEDLTIFDHSSGVKAAFLGYNVSTN
ncbi:hypothetical protein A3748_14810 [Erythrobacter sp. HI0077]|nr:hypothetical protein A3745_05375 [Erythrobacter sp. HI0074]KZY92005.1 hypothetical protein A3745_16380 [Erythrobacter sp. HI0074]KZZ07317.1 hypothetical protein A3748_14810 [Erythrobacter sp. HI0077]